MTDIPDVIRHDVSEMALNDVIHISDLKLPPNVKAIQDADLVVAKVEEVQEEAAAPTAEGFRVFAVAMDESSCRGAGVARVAAKISCTGRAVPAGGAALPGYRVAVHPGYLQRP